MRNDRQEGGKEGGDHAPAAGLVAHDCKGRLGGRRVRRKNEPLRQKQNSNQ